jgi:hypothetical protein
MLALKVGQAERGESHQPVRMGDKIEGKLKGKLRRQTKTPILYAATGKLKAN